MTNRAHRAEAARADERGLIARMTRVVADTDERVREGFVS
ncbi:hypothetical protein WA016_03378 [Myxococcus stipitatus]